MPLDFKEKTVNGEMVIGYNNPTQFFWDVYVKCIDLGNWKSSRPKKVSGLGWMIHGSQGFRTTGYAKFG